MFFVEVNYPAEDYKITIYLIFRSLSSNAYILVWAMWGTKPHFSFTTKKRLKTRNVCRAHITVVHVYIFKWYFYTAFLTIKCSLAMSQRLRNVVINTCVVTLCVACMCYKQYKQLFKKILFRSISKLHDNI